MNRGKPQGTGGAAEVVNAVDDYYFSTEKIITELPEKVRAVFFVFYPCPVNRTEPFGTSSSRVPKFPSLALVHVPSVNWKKRMKS